MNPEISNRLLEYRKANGYSQEELAEKLGVSRQAISNWERNESSPDTDNLIALASLYGVSIDELLKGSEKPKKTQNTASDNEQDSSFEEYYDKYKSAEAEEKSSYTTGTDNPESQTTQGTAQNAYTAEPTGNYNSEPIHNYNTTGTYYTPNGTAPAVPVKTRKNRSTASTVILAIVITIIIAITTVIVVSIIGAFSFLNTGFPNVIGKSSNIIGEIVGETIGYYDNYSDKNYTVGGGEITPVRKLDIDWVSGAVQIKHYDGKTISFSETEQSDTDYQMRYKVEQDTLYIKFCKPHINIGNGVNNSPLKTLTILVPNGVDFAELDISSTSADMIIEKINANELDIAYVSGDIKISGSYREISTEGVSGNVDLYNTATAFNCEMNTVSGDCTLRLPADTKGFTCEYESVSGTVSSEDFDGFVSSKTLNDTEHMYGNGENGIDFETVSGSLDIVKD